MPQQNHEWLPKCRRVLQGNCLRENGGGGARTTGAAPWRYSYVTAQRVIEVGFITIIISIGTDVKWVKHLVAAGRRAEETAGAQADVTHRWLLLNLGRLEAPVPEWVGGAHGPASHEILDTTARRVG